MSKKDRILNRTLLHRGCPCCSKMFKTTYTTKVLFYYLRWVFPDCVCEYPDCLAALPQLAAEWDYTANEARTPENVLPGSNHKAGWICSICGHR